MVRERAATPAEAMWWLAYLEPPSLRFGSFGTTASKGGRHLRMDAGGAFRMR